MVLAIIFFSFLLIYIVALIFYNITSPELRWDWSLLNLGNIKFPKNFKNDWIVVEAKNKKALEERKWRLTEGTHARRTISNHAGCGKRRITAPWKFKEEDKTIQADYAPELKSTIDIYYKEDAKNPTLLDVFIYQFFL